MATEVRREREIYCLSFKSLFSEFQKLRKKIGYYIKDRFLLDFRVSELSDTF